MKRVNLAKYPEGYQIQKLDGCRLNPWNCMDFDKDEIEQLYNLLKIEFGDNK